MDLAERAQAAVELVSALTEIEGRGCNLVTALLDGASFTEFEHYPSGDVRDPVTGAQYYLHAHRGGIESAHIHCFLHRRGKVGMTHVAAIGLDRIGRPAQLFTTNLWVTGDDFCPAEHLIPLLGRMTWSFAPGPSAVNRVLGALFQLYRPEIAALLRRRDRRLSRHAALARWVDPKTDEALEILSTMRVDLEKTLASLRARLGLAQD